MVEVLSLRVTHAELPCSEEQCGRERVAHWERFWLLWSAPPAVAARTTRTTIPFRAEPRGIQAHQRDGGRSRVGRVVVLATRPEAASFRRAELSLAEAARGRVEWSRRGVPAAVAVRPWVDCSLLVGPVPHQQDTSGARVETSLGPGRGSVGMGWPEVGQAVVEKANPRAGVPRVSSQLETAVWTSTTVRVTPVTTASVSTELVRTPATATPGSSGPNATRRVRSLGPIVRQCRSVIEKRERC